MCCAATQLSSLLTFFPALAAVRIVNQLSKVFLIPWNSSMWPSLFRLPFIIVLTFVLFFLEYFLIDKALDIDILFWYVYCA